MKGRKQSPLGTESYRDSEGWVVKVSLSSVKWKRKSEIIWEKYNGPIPENHYIRFLDGDRNNFDIDNLVCVSRYVHIFLNQKNNRDITDPELIKQLILVGQLLEKRRIIAIKHGLVDKRGALLDDIKRYNQNYYYKRARK